MSVESTRKVMQKYWDLEFKGPEAVGQMLHWFYHVAFDARAEVTSTLIGDGKALIEAMVIGKHVGEYAGIPATGKDFRVPLCVVYHLENDRIKEGRVQQLGMLPTPQGATA